MIFESIDEKIMGIVEADDILRKQYHRYKGTTLVLDVPWSIILDPWSIQWIGKKDELCQVQIMMPPLKGDKLSMFLVTTDGRDVINLIVFHEEYVSLRQAAKEAQMKSDKKKGEKDESSID